MTTLDVGLGARQVLDLPATGRVVGVYRTAAYLRFPAGLLALTSGRAPRGPLHLRVARLPSLRTGAGVRTDGTTLTATTLTGATLAGAGWAVELGAPTWTGALPGFDARPPEVAQLEHLARTLGGRGPGLTPAGDDVLAGLLLAAHALGVAASELLPVARSVTTTDVAAAFLGWAARGQCIEPAHQWLDAVARADPAGVLRAGARLCAVGASSGRALLAGLRRGLRQLPCSEIQTARAAQAPGFDQRCGRSVG